MPASNSHFEVDRKGLAKLMARRPKGYVILELLQNAWDEDVSRVDITMEYDHGLAKVVVGDDCPEGFADLRHAYTLFAESRKKTDPTKRGRFNLGEKLVIAICDEVFITTTKGTIRFNKKGRHRYNHLKIERGTIFSATLRLKRKEYDEMVLATRQVIPPEGIVTTFNGEELPQREPLVLFEMVLPTEIAGEDGYLRERYRKTQVRVYAKREEEKSWLYEMGIPVVETGDTWHVDIGQKVLLNTDRDNVKAYFLTAIRAEVLSQMAKQIPEEDVSSDWVGEALGSAYEVRPEAVRTIIEKRFGPKRVIADPSDREAEKRAMAKGYTVIPGGAFNARQWEKIRETEAALPAGRVTPSPKPFSPDGSPLEFVPRQKWGTKVLMGVHRLEALAYLMTGGPVEILITNDRGWKFTATCGNARKLYLNVSRLSWAWFHKIGERQLELLIHELSHIRVSDHLSKDYADELCRLGAKLALVYGKEVR